jgi:hypothetical protein
MAIVAAEPRSREDGFRQQQAVGDDDGNIRLQRTESVSIGLVAKIDRCEDGNAELFGFAGGRARA